MMFFHWGLTKRFWFSASVSFIGIMILLFPRAKVEEFSWWLVVGTLAAVLSSFSSAVYSVYFKRLLEQGVKKSSIIFFRLVGLSLVLGVILLTKPDLFQPKLVLETSVLGLFGFTIPLFITLYVLQRVQISNFAMLLFLLPALTMIVAGSIGYVELRYSDIVACILILLGVVVYETRFIAALGR